MFATGVTLSRAQKNWYKKSRASFMRVRETAKL